VFRFAGLGLAALLAMAVRIYWRPGDTGGSSSRRVLGPEDRADFAPPRRTSDEDRLKAWEADLKRREEELRRRDDDLPPA
jgi:hypothetical protein